MYFLLNKISTTYIKFFLKKVVGYI